MNSTWTTLSAAENQARGIGQYAIDFICNGSGDPAEEVLRRVELFHIDAIACGVAALGCGMNAPCVLREEALTYPAAKNERGSTLLGSGILVKPEKAVVANCCAVRELDANGTNFGYNPRTGATKGEFGHNDFYPVVIAAAQQSGCDGATALRAMLCLDEIRGRLAEVFSLKDHKIDHVVHGGIASVAVYGALLGGTAEQIESAIGLLVAHYIPFRAIRAGHQLSDSKGASAAITAEMAVTSVHRAMRGFVGPGDILRNPQAIFRLFEGPASADESPFELQLATSGDDFAVMGMHFKLGLYEHQSAGAIQGLIDVLAANPALLESVEDLKSVRITIYEPAFSIIGDPAKRDPRTRQSADHSMVYIIGTLLRKALEKKQVGWTELMLMPNDYSREALFHSLTRRFMQQIEFIHGGEEYDAKYPDGIPTSLEIEHVRLGTLASGLVMYPKGHARNTDQDLAEILQFKFQQLATLGVDQVEELERRFANVAALTAQGTHDLYDMTLRTDRTQPK